MSFLILSCTKSLQGIFLLIFLIQKQKEGNSLVVQWLRLHTSVQGAWVQPLVRELRSHMLHGMAKKKKKMEAIKDRTRKSFEGRHLKMFSYPQCLAQRMAYFIFLFFKYLFIYLLLIYFGSARS